MTNHSHECEHTNNICECVSEEQLHEFLTNDDIIYDATQIYDALSDFTRFQILGALLLGEKSVTELQELLSVSQSATSHQLRLLRDRGLVAAKRKQEIDRQHYTIPNQRPKDKHCGKI